MGTEESVDIKNKTDLRILWGLLSEGCVSHLYSITASDLAKCDAVKFSGSKVRATLKKFIDCNYVAKGMQKGNASTYYILPEGIKLCLDKYLIDNITEEDISRYRTYISD